jgi:hypothetical protein
VEPSKPLRMSRVARKFLYPNAVVTLPDGTKVDPQQVDIVLLSGKATPDGDTQWTPVPNTEDGYRILVAGSAADPTDAVVIPPGGVDLWIRVVDNTEIDVTESRRIETY